MIGIKKILCPIDYSECSLEALKYATHFALRDSGKLYLMHVIDIRSLEQYAPFQVAIKPESEMITQIREDLWAKVPEEVRKKVEMEAIVTVGIPLVEILLAAKEKGVDMIVMGTHGRTGLAHVIMGSVAENVVRRAPCPVLTVRRT
ncbi:MAG: universal stress protein [Candidatus Brocadiales bacterium]|nr:universal stress protein [Candidatus Brocadiales bacterium]